MVRVNRHFARVLAGVEPYQAGERDMGVNTVIGYFAQHQAEELNPANEVLAEVEEVVKIIRKPILVLPSVLLCLVGMMPSRKHLCFPAGRKIGSLWPSC